MSSNKEIPEWVRTLRKDQIFFLETVETTRSVRTVSVRSGRMLPAP